MKGSYQRGRNLETREGIRRHEMIERDRGTELKTGGLLMTGHRIETKVSISDDGETFEVYDGKDV